MILLPLGAKMEAEESDLIGDCCAAGDVHSVEYKPMVSIFSDWWGKLSER